MLGLAVAPDVHAAPAKLPPNIPRPSVDLEPDGAGRLKHRGDGFTAIIYPDGSVEFRDHGGTADINFLGLDLWRRRLREPEPERHPPWFMGVIEDALFPGTPPRTAAPRSSSASAPASAASPTAAARTATRAPSRRS
ncbi:hypothetical protein [Nannocystis pusilla]|uniref:hypothetical protein n=1 Tax=Nannocystis pusilla TaxID=889268 RepID=UPI003B7BDB70